MAWSGKRAAIPFLLAGMLHACSPGESAPGTDRSGVPSVEARPTPRTAGPKVRGFDGEPPLVAVNQKANDEFPFANNAGRFAIRDGCVVLVGAERTFTPIFSRAPRNVHRGGMTFDFGEVAFEQEYTVSGGRVGLPSRNVSLTDEVLSRCPKTYYLVLSVEA